VIHQDRVFFLLTSGFWTLASPATAGLAYLGLAKIASKRNDRAKYTKYFEKAKNLDPNNPKIKEEDTKKSKM
jgi:Tfp pilus assembly protein PilF